MKNLSAFVLALSVCAAPAALAQADLSSPDGEKACASALFDACGKKAQAAREKDARERKPQDERKPQGERRPPPKDDAGPGPRGQGSRPNARTSTPRWTRGERLPERYRKPVTPDWRRSNLSPPPRGYQWVCHQGGHCFLVATRSGVIRETRWRDEREDLWRHRYSRLYTYRDDYYYRDCRHRSDPAGIIIGGLIGGLLGDALSDGRDSGAVVAGIIIGGALGAALTRDLDCDDRSYAYYSFYNGLNERRPGLIHRWNNPHNRHHGEFRVRNFYYDRDGFYCANYTHTAWSDRRRVASGHACRQPNGAWAFLR